MSVNMASSTSLCAFLRVATVCAVVMIVLKPAPVLTLQEHNNSDAGITALALEGSSDHPEVDDESDYQLYGHIFVIEHILGHEEQKPKARWRRNYYVMSFDSTRRQQQQERQGLKLENELENIKKVLNKEQAKPAQGNNVQGMEEKEKNEVDEGEDEQNVNITETTSSQLVYPPTTSSLLPDFTSVTLPLEALTRKPSDLKRMLGVQEDDQENDGYPVRHSHENAMEVTEVIKNTLNENTEDDEGSSPSLHEVLPPSEEQEASASEPSSVAQQESPRSVIENASEGEELVGDDDEVEPTVITTLAPPKGEENEEEEEEENEEEQASSVEEAPPSPSEGTPLESDITSSSSDKVVAEEQVTAPNPAWLKAHKMKEDRWRDEHVLEEVTTTEGTTVRLVCRVKGAITPMVEWQRGANLTFPDGEVRVGGDEVRLSYARPEDQGTYICTARRRQGASRTKGVFLRVQYAPRVRVWARDMVPTGEGGVEMGCLVEGWPTPSVAWYSNSSRLHIQHRTTNINNKDGQLFEIAEWKMSDRFRRSVLTLNKVTSADFATYHCRAHNSQGVARGHIVLHDGSGYLNTSRILASLKTVKMDEVEWQNSRLAAFLLSMVPPLYIALYIIAYLSCYKTSLSGSNAHGRFGTAGVTD